MSDMTIQNAIHCMKAMICEEVCEECDYYGKTGTDHCEEDAVRMAIKALEEQPHWIPCSERLPEEDEDVLVCSEEGDIDIACWLPEQWTDEPHIEWWSGEYRVYAVAWMPLPKPYGGESDE